MSESMGVASRAVAIRRSESSEMGFPASALLTVAGLSRVRRARSRALIPRRAISCRNTSGSTLTLINPLQVGPHRHQGRKPRGSSPAVDAVEGRYRQISAVGPLTGRRARRTSFACTGRSVQIAAASGRVPSYRPRRPCDRSRGINVCRWVGAVPASRPTFGGDLTREPGIAFPGRLRAISGSEVEPLTPRIPEPSRCTLASRARVAEISIVGYRRSVMANEVEGPGSRGLRLARLRTTLGNRADARSGIGAGMTATPGEGGRGGQPRFGP